MKLNEGREKLFPRKKNRDKNDGEDHSFVGSSKRATMKEIVLTKKTLVANVVVAHTMELLALLLLESTIVGRR